MNASLVEATLAADPSTGGVVLAGSYEGSSLTFGSTALPAPGPQVADVFVARLSAGGQWLAATASSSTTRFAQPPRLAVGPNGQVAVAGSYRGSSLTFGSHALTATNTYESFFVAQLSAGNQWQWALTGSNGTISTAIGLAYTSSGALWVSGRGSNGSVVGPTTLQAVNVAGRDSYAGFLGQVSTAGQWTMVQPVEPIGGGLAALAYLGVDAANNAVVLGGLRGYTAPAQISIGSQSITAPASTLVFFVASLSGAGRWHYAVPVPQPALADGLNPSDVVLDSQGHLYLTSALSGTIGFGSSQLSGSGTASAANQLGDVVLARLSNAAVLSTRPAQAAALTLYPNPAHDQVTLCLPAEAAARPLQLLDARGREVRRQLLPAQADRATLSLAGLAPGLYLLRCGSATSRLVVD